MSIDSMASDASGVASSSTTTGTGTGSTGVGNADFGAVGGAGQVSNAPSVTEASGSSDLQVSGANNPAQATLGQTDNTDGAGQEANANAQESTATNTPFTAEAYSFAMPAAVAQDSALVSRIQEFCVNSQLSPQQAQAAMSFWQNEQNVAMEQGLKQCEQSLKDRWQGAYNQKLEQARSTLKMLDSRMEGRLMPLMQGPLGNSPAFAEMLEKLSDVVSETTMEAGGMGGTRGSYAGSQLMSTEDFLRQVVFK